MKEILDELKECRARHTELITVYIPGGFNIHQVIKQLEDERGTANNIKSTATRKNVINALEKATRKLREYKQTPKNGLAVFSGNISKVSGREDLRAWAIEPPKKLNRRLYRCDQSFVLDPLYQLIGDNEFYLLVVIENGDCAIGTYSNGTILLKKRLQTLIPSDNRAGGQSSVRFAGVRKELKKAFMKKVALYINGEFLFDKNLKGLILGGTFVTVDEFKKSKHINTQLKEKIVCVKSISGTGENGLRELAYKSSEDIASREIIKKENIVEDFFMKLSVTPDKVVYGLEDVNKMISLGRVSHIITCDKSIEYKDKTILDKDIRRYEEILGLGGTVAFLHY